MDLLPLHPKIVHLPIAERFVWAAGAVLLLAITGAAVRNDAYVQHGAANAWVVPAR